MAASLLWPASDAVLGDGSPLRRSEPNPFDL